MEARSTSPESYDEMSSHDGSRRPGWTEFAFIAAFWSFLALLMATSRLVDPHLGQMEGGGFVGRELGRAFATYGFWVVATPFVFRFISRYNFERHNWKRRVGMHLAI